MVRAAHKKSHRLRNALLGTLGVATCSLAVAIGCMGLSFATASSDPDSVTGFGISHPSAKLTANVESSTTFAVSGAEVSDGLALQASAQRDISQGINEIVAEENRIQQEAIDRANNARSAYLNRFGSLPLGDVDWTIGKDAFIAQWTERINNYLAGFPLAGHGEDFATAAWEYGVDPRWSPAISNTESTRGSVCFLPHNAWGWGASSWDSWTDAIYAHVRGLSEGYGYTISYAFAQKYCPPNYDNWYRDTLGQMNRI